MPLLVNSPSIQTVSSKRPAWALCLPLCLAIFAILWQSPLFAQTFEVLDDFEDDVFDVDANFEITTVQGSAPQFSINAMDTTTNDGELTIDFGPKDSTVSIAWKDQEKWLTDIGDFVQVDVRNFDDTGNGATAPGLILHNGIPPPELATGTGVRRANSFWFWARSDGSARVNLYRGVDFRIPGGDQYAELTSAPAPGYEVGDVVTLLIQRTGDRSYRFSVSHEGGPFQNLTSSTHPNGVVEHPDDFLTDEPPTTPGMMLGLSPPFITTFDNFAVGTGDVPPRSVSELVCDRSLDGLTTDLSWTNNGAYDAIRILRDDNEIATLPGTDTSYQDTPVPPGPRTYTVWSVVGEDFATEGCTVEDPANLPQTNLVCNRSGDGTSTSLSWDNNGTYEAVKLERERLGGVVEEILLDGSVSSYDDNDAPPGILTYTVIAEVGGTTLVGPSCEVDDPANPPISFEPIVLDDFEGAVFNDHGMFEFAPIQGNTAATSINTIDTTTNPGELTIDFGGGDSTISIAWNDPATWLDEPGDFVQVDVRNFDDTGDLGTAPGLVIHNGLPPPVGVRGCEGIPALRRANSFIYWLRSDGTFRVNAYNGTCFQDVPRRDQYLDLRTDTFDPRRPEDYAVGDKVTLRVLRTGGRTFELYFAFEGEAMELFATIEHEDGPDDVVPIVPGMLMGLGNDFIAAFDNYGVGSVSEYEDLPSDLVCNRSPDSLTVDLNWTNNAPRYVFLVLERDGEELIQLADDATSFQDTNVPPGPHSYAIVATTPVVVGGPSCLVEDLVNLPPSGLVCTRSPDGMTANLSWTNNGIYDALTLVRTTAAGVVEETDLATNVNSFEDTNVPPRTVTYTVEATIGKAPPEGPSCAATDPANPPPVPVVLDDFEEEEFNLHGNWSAPIQVQGALPSELVQSIDQDTNPGFLTVDFGGIGGGTTAYAWTDPAAWLDEVGKFAQVTVTNSLDSTSAAPGLIVQDGLDPPELSPGNKRGNSFYFWLSGGSHVRVNAYRGTTTDGDQYNERRADLVDPAYVPGDAVTLRIVRTDERQFEFLYKRVEIDEDFITLGTIDHPDGLNDVVPTVSALALGLGPARFVATFDNFSGTAPSTGQIRFVRGDANADGTVNIADPSFNANFVFGIGAALTPPCMDAADANADGAVNIADVSFIANFVFGVPPASVPPAPGPTAAPNCGSIALADLKISCLTPPPACPQ